MIRRAIHYGQIAFAHSRDVEVVHSVGGKIFFDIPLYRENGMKLLETRIESGRLIIICEGLKTSKDILEKDGTPDIRNIT